MPDSNREIAWRKAASVHLAASARIAISWLDLTARRESIASPLARIDTVGDTASRNANQDAAVVVASSTATVRESERSSCAATLAVHDALHGTTSTIAGGTSEMAQGRFVGATYRQAASLVMTSTPADSSAAWSSAVYPER